MEIISCVETIPHVNPSAHLHMEVLSFRHGMVCPQYVVLILNKVVTLAKSYFLGTLHLNWELISWLLHEVKVVLIGPIPT